MVNDGQTYLWIPSCLSLSSLNELAVQIMNTVHVAIGKPLVTTSSQNPYVLSLNDLDMGGAAFYRDVEPGMARSGPIANLSYLDLNYVSLIVAFGTVANEIDSRLYGDIEGMTVFFELDSINTPCPFSTANPKETWATWGTFGESHKPMQIGNKWYRSSNVGESGEALLASQWVPLRNSGALTVLTVGQYQEIQQANQPVI